MGIALVPRRPSARSEQPNPLAPTLSLAGAATVTLLLASAVAALVPASAPAAEPTRRAAVQAPAVEGIGGPVHVLPAVQVIAKR